MRPVETMKMKNLYPVLCKYIAFGCKFDFLTTLFIPSSTVGYYCVLGANTSTPTDGTTGDICPTGHYCPESSSVVSPCPMGYYLDAVQQVDLSDCKLCPAGQYCPTSGAANSAGDCTQGYYCPGGQNSSTPHDFK